MLKVHAFFGAASLIALMAVDHQALAQIAASPAATPAPVVADATTEIVVTGSRISRRDYTSESPIVTVGQDLVKNSGPVQIQTTLDQLPQFAATNGAATSSPAAQGRDNANLRGLGIQRTLVLLDGRRLQPSDSLNTVDLNTIPTALLENVDVITGGASAAYGSDAIAGVVNFRLKQHFTGAQVDAQYGETSRGDGGTEDVAMTIGVDSADHKGNVVVSLDYYNRDQVELGSRPFFANSLLAGVLPGGVIVAQSTNLPSKAALNAIFNGKYGSTATIAQNQSLGVNPNGTLFTSTAPVANLLYPTGQPYTVDPIGAARVTLPLGNQIPLQTPLTRYNLFSRGTYEVANHIQAYAQVYHTEYSNLYTRAGWASPTGPASITIPVTNPFIPADLAALLASRPNPNAPATFQFNTSKVGLTTYDDDYSVSQFLVGAKGDLPRSDWTWDAYTSYGSTALSDNVNGFVDTASLQGLLNAPDGGASHCPGGYNPFTPTPIQGSNSTCFNYLDRKLHNETKFTQQVVELSAQGPLYKLPAGELKLALGVDYRRNTFSFDPDEQLVNNTVLPAQPTAAVSGATDVKELFIEALVPVLKDMPLIKRFDLDLAYRYSDYNTVGGVSTYEASGDWEVTNSIRFRGGYQRAIRAPALGELYAPPSTASALIGSTASGGGDPCDVSGVLRNPAKNVNAAKVTALCQALGVPANLISSFKFIGSAVNSVTSGNTDLKEETANTETIGVVWRPRFDHPLLARLNFSVDYYNINVENAIGTITSQISLSRCFNADGASNPTYSPTNQYCQLTTRDSSGNIILTTQPTQNLAAYRTSGVDTEADWGFDLSALGLGDRYGKVDFNLLVTYLASFEIQNAAGQAFQDYSGTIGNAQIDAFTISFPKWKVAASATYAVGPATLSLKGRWYDAMTNANNVGVASGTQPGVDSRIYFDLTSQWKLNEKLVLRAGMLNVADTQPPKWTGDGVTDAALYDLLGRRYYLGLTAKF